VEIDVLGPPYEAETLDLGRDDEGPVVATLVRRRAEGGSRRAVLYVHGYIDYFFQTHLADFFVAQGWDFYALDLRKYGRSLRGYQTPNFCRDVTDYYPELDRAARLVRDRDGHDTLLVNAHSTGGLITALWAHDRRAAGLVDGLLLNSPFFDFNAPWFVRRPLAAAVGGVGRGWPYRLVPLGLPSVYGQSVHRNRYGEWDYDLAWKPLGGFGVRTGWLHAIRRAQRRLRAGLAISAPVLLACSASSLRCTRWREEARSCDTVLDVAHMVRWGPMLGPHVTIARFAGGLHDLTLSPEPVRRRVLDEFARWATAYVAGPAGAAAAPTPRPATPAAPG